MNSSCHQPEKEMVMTRLLPALYQGHAPVYLHLAFDEALDAFEEWLPHQDEPQVIFEGRSVAISSVFGRMRSCTDLLPSRIKAAVDQVLGREHTVLGGDQATYGDAARIIRAQCVERLRRRLAA
jgi:hypothetical protein